MIDKFGENFNEDVLQWKENKEYGCKLDLHISSIKEEIVAMKREQEETIIIAGSLDVDIFLPDIECSSIPQTRNEEDTLSTDINKTELKKRVNVKLGGKFEENMFDETLPAIHYAHVDVPGYQIIGDNVDFLVKAKHMSSTKQNDSVHWFNLNGILDRVSGHEYLNDKPIKSICEVENIDFLPSPKDNQDLLHNLIPLVSRIVVSRIPALQHVFKKAVVWHIPHSYSSVMGTKSDQV